MFFVTFKVFFASACTFTKNFFKFYPFLIIHQARYQNDGVPLTMRRKD